MSKQNVSTTFTTRSRRWVRLGLGLSSALVLVALVLVGMAAVGRAAPLAIRKPGLEVHSDPPGGSKDSQRELFAHPPVSATFVITLQNSTGYGAFTATNGLITATIFPSTTLAGSPDSSMIQNAPDGDNRVVVWATGQLTPGQEIAVTLLAGMPDEPGNVLGTELDFEFETWIKGEDNDEKTNSDDLYYYYGPYIDPDIQTSVDVVGNDIVTQAVAGEMVNVTVVFTLPRNTLAYTATPRILFQDGLSPTAQSTWTGDTDWVTTTTKLDANQAFGRNQPGHMIEFAPFTVTDEAADVVRTYTVTAVALRDYALAAEGGMIPHNTPLIVQSLLRWCEAPGCVLDEKGDYVWHTGNAYTVDLVRPEVDPEIGYTYPDAPGIGQGGGTVQFVITNVNSTDHPPAYDLVLTATLDAALTYQTVEPAGECGYTGSGVVTCTHGTLNSGVSWPVTITAQLPSTLTVGEAYTIATVLQQDTYAGDVAGQGVYTDQTGFLSIVPGLTEGGLSKSVTPDRATIGDVVTYTIVLTQGAGSELDSPRFVDILPLGLHYVNGSLTVQGGSLDGSVSLGANDDQREEVSWTLNDLSQTGEESIEITFQARLTGKDTDGAEVYVTDDRGRLIVDDEIEDNYNDVELYAMVGGQEEFLKEIKDASQTSVTVVQPLMEIKGFDRQADDFLEVEEGNTTFQLDVENAGESTAYEITVCDQLPQGIRYLYEAPNSHGKLVGVDDGRASANPDFGSVGQICWQFDQLSLADDDISILYLVEAYDQVIPGRPLMNEAFISVYSSQAGDVTGERLYHQIPALQTYEDARSECDDFCPYYVNGLEVYKTVQPSAFVPGGRLTYTIAYTDTSLTANYSNLVISDVFDSDSLIYVSADPTPTLTDTSTADGLVVWEGLTPLGTPGQVTLVLDVKDLLDGVESVTNRYAWYSQASLPDRQQPMLQQTITTPLAAPKLSIQFTDPVTPYAGGTVIYTVLYTNTGTASGNVTLTLDYDDYLTFGTKLSGDAVDMGGTGTQFTHADLLNDGLSRTLQLSLAVDAPLPYDLTALTSDVTIESAGVSSKTDEITLDLARPVFVLDKIGPDAAPSQTGQSMFYQFELKNTGNLTATQCRLTDTWDSSTSFLSGNGWDDSLGTYGIYTVTGSLAPNGGTAEVDSLTIQVNTLQNVYTNTLALECAEATGLVVTERTWAPSIATTKSADPVPAFPGRELRYTIYYTNTAPFSVGDATIVDDLPDGFSYVGHSESQGSGCNQGWDFDGVVAGKATWSCVSLKIAPTGQLEIWGTVTAAEDTMMVNRTETSGDGVPLRPIEAPLYTRVARPWLSITKSDGDIPPVAPGEQFLYTLTYSNTGTDPAYDVVVQDQLPSQVEFVECSPSPCTEDSGLVTWNRGTVPTDTQSSVTVMVEAKADTGGETAINAAYTIQSERLSTADTQTGAAVQTQILDPHLNLAKTASPQFFQGPSETLYYTVTYENDGGGVLTGVVITDALSTNTLFQSASPECTHSGETFGGVVTCAIGTLAQGEHGVVQIEVESGQTASNIVNQAEGASDQTAAASSNEATVLYDDGCFEVTEASIVVLAGSLGTGGDVTFNVGQGGTFAAYYEPDSLAALPITYTWDFGGPGDASGTDGQTEVYTYSQGGTYTVTLTVDNPCPEAAVETTLQVKVISGTDPDIDLSDSAFDVSLAPGETTQRTLTISNVGGAVLNWSLLASPEVTWLSVAPASGAVAPSEGTDVTLDFDATGLGEGDYSTTLEITSDDPDEGSVTVPVTLTVSVGAGPDIALSATTFDVSLPSDETAERTLTISNEGDADLDWNLSVPSEATWLSVAPISGTVAPAGESDVTLTFDTAGMSEEDYSTTLVITSNDPVDSSVNVTVNLSVTQYEIYLPLVLRSS